MNYDYDFKNVFVNVRNMYGIVNNFRTSLYNNIYNNFNNMNSKN